MRWHRLRLVASIAGGLLALLVVDPTRGQDSTPETHATVPPISVAIEDDGSAWTGMVLPFAAGVLAAVLGAGVTHRLTVPEARRREQARLGSIRSVLAVELGHNIAYLGSYWEALSRSWTGKDFYFDDVARAFAERPLPSWLRQVFDAQAVSLPDALNASVLVEVYQHHAHLSHLEDLHRHLLRMVVSDAEDWRAAGVAHGNASAVPFSGQFARVQVHAKAVMLEADWIARAVLGAGNPLGGSSPLVTIPLPSERPKRAKSPP